MAEFRKDERGTTALMFAIALSAMMTAIGVAVDISRVTSSDALLQDVVDTAALAGAIAAEEPLDVRLQTVQKALELNAAG